MLYNVDAVKANIRNRDGKRVFFLGGRDNLTPSARDWLRHERIEILPSHMAKITAYQLPQGEVSTEKAEEMTHLRGNNLVPKTHPIIAFRGKMDTLQAEILWAQLSVDTALRQALDEILTLARNILRWEVMEEDASCPTLCGLTLQEQRLHSHHPQEYYGQPHFMPGYADGATVLCLNRLRCAAREAELAAARAFEKKDGICARPDILQLLNRMSSMLYILMIREKSKEGGHHG